MNKLKLIFTSTDFASYTKKYYGYVMQGSAKNSLHCTCRHS